MRSWRGLRGICTHLIPTGSEKRGVLGVETIPVAILPSCQCMRLLLHNCKDINILGGKN